MQILAEEEGHDVEVANPEFGDRRMTIDPIDSTFNFKQATSFHACSVAVEEYRNTENSSEGEWVTIAGVVAQPVEDKFYFAEEGKGAFLVSTISKFDFADNKVESEMVTERIKVRTLAQDEHPLKDRTLHVCLSKRAQHIEAEVGQQLVDNYDRRVQRLIDVGALQTAQIGTDASPDYS